MGPVFSRLREKTSVVSVIMQTHAQNHKDSRCVTLVSPRNLYDYLLLYIYEKFGKREKDLFEFCFRDDLPCSVLESGDPLKWFKTLEQQGKLSWNDVNFLVDFLKQASCGDLVSAARHYQARIRIIQFFQRHLQAKLPKFCLGKISNNNIYDCRLYIFVA